MREAIQVANDFQSLRDEGDRDQRRRRFRELMAECGASLQCDSKWKSLKFVDPTIDTISHSSISNLHASPFKNTSASDLISWLKERQEEYEVKFHSISYWRTAIDFHNAHHFLEYLFNRATIGALAKWNAQLPPLATWTFRDAKGDEFTLVSDTYPGTDSQLDDYHSVIALASIEALQEVDLKTKEFVENHETSKEMRLRATLQHIDQLLPDDSNKAEIDSSRRSVLCQISEIEEEGKANAENIMIHTKAKTEDGTIRNAALFLETHLLGSLHTNEIELPDNLHKAICKVVQDSDGALRVMSPTDASKTIRAMRSLLDQEGHSPLPIALPEFRSIRKSNDPWFVVEWVESDFMLFHYTMAAIIKTRTYLQLNPGISLVLESRTRALLKLCIETPTLPKNLLQLFEKIYLHTEPTSLDQIEQAVRFLDESTTKITTRPTRIPKVAILLRYEYERIEMPHGSITELPRKTPPEYPEAVGPVQNKEPNDISNQKQDLQAEESAPTRRGLIWEICPNSKDLRYGDCYLGEIGTARYGNAPWAVLMALYKNRRRSISISDLSIEIDEIARKAAATPMYVEDTNAILSGDDRYGRSQQKVGSRSPATSYSYQSSREAKTNIMASIRTRNGPDHRKWRDYWIHWDEENVIFDDQNPL